MNLKYYLRGLGIGIVVSTLIVGIAASKNSKTLSDEEIRQRARELGMVEASGVLADTVPSAEETTKEDVIETLEAEEPSPIAMATVKPTAEEMSESTTDKAEASATEKIAEPTAEKTAESPLEQEMQSTQVKASEPTAEPVIEPTAEPATEPKEEIAEGTTLTITIRGGEGSYSVCKKLEEAGLIDSATAYDTFLYEKGYDKRIIAATHEIPVGADEEQIAKIITGKN